MKGIDELLANWGPMKVGHLIREAFDSRQGKNVHYRRRDNSLWRTTSTRDGTSEIQLTSFDAQIISEVVEDNGSERRRLLEIQAFENCGQAHVFTLTAQEFSMMNWPIEKMGSGAIVYPQQKDHARAAIQALSDSPRKRVLYTHIGWREIEGHWIYLHAGGAIGAYGHVPGIDVKAGRILRAYELQLPSWDERIRAIQTSLSLLGLAPTIMYLLVAAVYRAALKPCDFSLHVAGPSGVFKSSVAALVQQHFGAGMDDRNLPGSWSSTGNALEALAFEVKDAVFVVDDFAPAGNLQNVNRLQATAERLIRAAGNLSARSRLTADGCLQEGKPPRGLVVSTGEDIPPGHSVAARLLMLEIGKGDIDVPLLTKLQSEARKGFLSQSMAGFVQWVSRDYLGTLASIDERVKSIRDELGSAAHARTPRIVADLLAGFEIFLTYALEAGAIDQSERERHCQNFRVAAMTAVHDQENDQKASEPTAVYFGLLRTGIASLRAYVADATTGGPPAQASAWGWRRGVDERDWKPFGIRIGWISEDALYIEADAAYLVAQDVAKTTGENLAISKRTLNRRLNERGVLLSRAANRGTYAIRRQIEGVCREVLHLPLDALRGDRDTKS